MMARPDFEQAVQTRLERKPFQPFIVELDDGDRFFVGQREAIMYRGGTTAVFFAPDGNFDFVDCEAVRQIWDVSIAAPA